MDDEEKTTPSVHGWLELTNSVGTKPSVPIGDRRKPDPS